VLNDPDGREEGVEGSVGIAVIESGLHRINEGCVERFQCKRRLVQHDRPQRQRLRGREEAVRRAARVADEVDTVTCGGHYRQHVFHFALQAVVGAIAAVTRPRRE
jgi:hypothetical protein